MYGPGVINNIVADVTNRLDLPCARGMLDLLRAAIFLLGDNCEESDMLKTATVFFPDASAAWMQEAARFFTDEFLAVALFSGIGLLVSLIAVFSGEQGVWL
jgi:hypothetical protein